MMVNPNVQRNGFTISPLLVIAVIFTGLLLIEGLLFARFWVQLAAANASDGLQGLVLDLSRPLVSPFSGAGATAQDSVGSFDRNTLVAAMVYLGVAVVLVVATTLAGSLLDGKQHLVTRRRRGVLQQLDNPLMASSGARLIGTAALPMSPAQATRTLRMLQMDRRCADLFVIPAEGGCIVAAFEDAQPGGIARRVVRTQEVRSTRKALRNIERRFQPAALEQTHQP